MDNQYILDRDFKASVRLNHQHYEFVNVTRHLLHPRIPISGRDGLQIADIPTGTGIWAADVASQLHPNTTIDGYDISAAQFPAATFLPPNVKLRGGFDVFKTPPPELWGAYDIIHVRLLVLVVAKDPKPVIHNLARLLKPGGYLQWSEIDIADCEVRGPPNAPRQSLIEVREVISGPASTRDERCGWVQRLDEYFRECGLTDCYLERYKEGPKPPFNAFMSLSRISVAQEVSNKILRKEDDVKRFALTCQQAAAEVNQGSYCHLPLATAIGRLPGGV